MDSLKFFEIRENLNLTQGRLAKLLGVTIYSIQGWEQKKTIIPKPIHKLMYLLNKRHRSYKRTNVSKRK